MHCSSFDPVFVTHLTNIARMFSPIWSFRVCLCVCLSVCLFLQQKTVRLLLQKKTYRKTDTRRRTWKQRSLNLFELKSFNLTQWRHHVVAKRDDVIVKSRQVTRDCETASPKPRSLLPSPPHKPRFVWRNGDRHPSCRVTSHLRLNLMRAVQASCRWTLCIGTIPICGSKMRFLPIRTFT